MCSYGMHRECSRRSRELGLCQEFFGTGSALIGNKGRKLGQLDNRRCVHVSTSAFNPQNGGGGGSGGGGGTRSIVTLAGAGLLIYLFITGRLGWLIDAVLTLWLLSPLLSWLVSRFMIKGPCPNCGGEFEVFEFTLKEEYRLCPYCSQPFKLENKKFVRDAPHFSDQRARGFRQPFGGFGDFQDFDGPTYSRKREDQQTRGFRQPFGGSGDFQDFGGPTYSRKREDPSGVIVDVEAEVMDKD